MRSPDGIISSILIMVAGPASVDQLTSCDCIETPFSNSGLDLESGCCGIVVSGEIYITTAVLSSFNEAVCIRKCCCNLVYNVHFLFKLSVFI